MLPFVARSPLVVQTETEGLVHLPVFEIGIGRHAVIETHVDIDAGGERLLNDRLRLF